ncbi:DUF4232 domain-containing protein [Streptomyces sp. NPDC012600]|uniref:DUF4232 domain-containing protein n=1 Tax=Streptomyces sp. NPDC012600 TaxID=3415005 RepID=UPI003C2CC03F
MRTNRIRTTALAATALVAALSLTACTGNEGTKSAGSAPAASSAPTAPEMPEASETPEASKAPETSASPAEAPSGSAATPAPGNTNGTAQSAKGTAAKDPGPVRTACTTANTKVTVTKVTRPINHLLLTLKNTGSGYCNAYYAPHLGFDGAQSVFPILEDSKPQAVTTLAPGEEAYAGIGLSGEPGQGKLHKSKNLTVHFAKSNGSTYDKPATLKLPSETFWDDNGFVTYWLSDRADALMY